MKKNKLNKAVTPRPDRPKLSWQRLRHAGLPLAICALVFLVYARSFWCSFVRDDILQIVDNKQLQSWSYLPKILGSHLWNHAGPEVNALFYRPVFSVWMLLMYTIAGLSTWFWHLSSIALHVFATYLVFRLCQRLTGSQLGAAAGAALFAVHPIHVDAVTWVSASCEELFGIFALAAILALLGPDREAPPRIWVSTLCFGAALFSKETAIALLALLPIMAWLRLKNWAVGSARFWSAFLPFGVGTIAWLLIRMAAMGRTGVETGEHTWTEVVFTTPSIILFYLDKLLLPWRLSGCYINSITGRPTAAFFLESFAILGGLVAIAWFAIRKRSLLGLAVAIVVVPILPALLVVRVYPQGDMTHDRYLYLSSAGLSLLLAILVKQSGSWGRAPRIATVAVVAAILIAFSAETAFQQHFYQDDPAFYARALDIAPTNALSRSMRANAWLDQKDPEPAVEELRRAHRDAPDNQKVTLFLARGLFVAGKHAEAEDVLNKLLQTPDLDPHRQKAALLSLANVEISMGKLDYSQQLLQQVDQSDDRFPELHWAFGVLYQKEGMFPQALAEYEKEYQISGDELAQQRSAKLSKRIYSQNLTGLEPAKTSSR